MSEQVAKGAACIARLQCVQQDVWPHGVAGQGIQGQDPSPASRGAAFVSQLFFGRTGAGRQFPVIQMTNRTNSSTALGSASRSRCGRVEALVTIPTDPKRRG